jgi:hypothetical protein
MWSAAKRRLQCGVYVVLLIIGTASAQAQQREELLPTVNPWNDRAQLLTADLLDDVKSLDTYDRAALWGRLADVWWSEDPKRARNWFLNGLKLVESSPADDKVDHSCRLVATRTLLSISAARAPEFSDRLTTILTRHVDRNNADQTSENATALVEAGLAMVATNPQEAGRLGAESLNLGLSLRLANLLWKLRNRDKPAGDALFNHLIGVAKSTYESNLVSMLLSAAFQGPYKTAEHQAAVLGVLAEGLYNNTNAPAGPTNCHLVSLATANLSFFEQVFPLQSQRMRAAIAGCSPPNSSMSKSIAQEGAKLTVEQLLQSAERAESDEQKNNTLLAASDLAAREENFDEAIRILDSVSLDGQKRLGDTWDSRRWNHAASAACAYLQAVDLPAMTRTIDNAPNSLKAFVRLTIVTECLPQKSAINPIDLLGPARNELDNAPVAKTVSWRLSMVRLYAKYSSSVAPAVLNEAVTAINKTEQKPAECGSSGPAGGVLSNPVLANSYKIPATLLERDDAGVRYALGSVRPVDKRAMLRLQLLKDVLVQKAARVKSVPEKKTNQ